MLLLRRLLPAVWAADGGGGTSDSSEQVFVMQATLGSARDTSVAAGRQMRHGCVATMDDMIFERLPRRHTALLLLVAVVVLALVGRRLAAAGSAQAPAAQAAALREAQ